jgi:hypothetical protein
MFQFGLIQDLDPEMAAGYILAAISAMSFLPCLLSTIFTILSGEPSYYLSGQ